MYRTDEYVFSYPNSAVHYCMALTQHTIYTVKARAICIIMLFLVLLDVFGYVVPNYDTHTADQTEISNQAEDTDEPGNTDELFYRNGNRPVRFVPYRFPTCSHSWFISITIPPLTTGLPHGRYIPCSAHSLFSTQPYSFTGRKHNIIYYKTAVSYIVILRSHIL